MTTTRFFRRTRKVEAPRLTIIPEQHSGRTGYSIFEEGRRIAWGQTEAAAKAAYQVARCA